MTDHLRFSSLSSLTLLLPIHLAEPLGERASALLANPRFLRQFQFEEPHGVLPAPSLKDGCFHQTNGCELLVESRDRIFIFVHIDRVTHLCRPGVCIDSHLLRPGCMRPAHHLESCPTEANRLQLGPYVAGPYVVTTERLAILR